MFLNNMSSFCGPPFWVSSISWNTETPDLTKCFENTILTWTPTYFILLSSIANFIFCAHPPQEKIKLSLLALFQHSFALCLIILQATLCFLTFWWDDPEDINSYPMDLSQPLIKMATYAFALALQLFMKRKGIISSAVLFLFWLITTVCSTFEFAGALGKYYHYGSQKYYNDYLNELITLVSFPLIIGEFILHFFADGSTNLSDKLKDAAAGQTNKPCPQNTSSVPCRYTYQWMYTLLWNGFKRPLGFSDLWELDEENKMSTLFQEFNYYWKESVHETKKWNDIQGNIHKSKDKKKLLITPPRRNSNILPALWRTNRTMLCISGFLRLVHEILSFLLPHILSLLIAHVAVGSSDEEWKGYVYAGAMLIIASCQTLCSVNHDYILSVVGMRLEIILSQSVYHKSLLLSNAARSKFTTGQIVNLMSVDSQIFKMGIIWIHYLWSAPFTFLMVMYLLYDQLGNAALVGLVVCFVLLPANSFLMTKVKYLKSQQLKKKDERTRILNEMLAGIKVLKMYAWEPAFEKKVGVIREEEIDTLRWAGYILSTTTFIVEMTPNLVALVSFGAFILFDSQQFLTAGKAFVSISLLNMLRKLIAFFPVAISSTVQILVSLKRLNKFMNAEEISPDSVTHRAQENGKVVLVNNASFHWDLQGERILKKINLEVQQKSLVAIVGPVGSGKSSLLSAILGEMEKTCGIVNTTGKIAYVPQQAWIQNATFRDNILFGKHFDPLFYKEVIKACALEPDLKILPGRDLTEIGEKGINLSGGQKQRVALARAIYNRADIYLFDDPLSAVDAHVGKHIFKEIIGPNGLLKYKTRIMVTHGITYLSQVDNIVVMEEGEIRESGTLYELMNHKGAFANYIVQHSTPDDSDNESFKLSDEDISLSHISLCDGKTTLIEESGSITKGKHHDKHKLIQTEHSEVGNVKQSVYAYFLQSIGWMPVIGLITLYTTGCGLNISSTFCLMEWSRISVVNETFDSNNNQDYYLEMYGGLVSAQAIFTFTANVMLTLGCLKASKLLHKDMLTRILRSPMSFFDTTPLGRIINVFSKDVDTLDNLLPLHILLWVGAGYRVFGAIVAIVLNTPLFLAFLVPVGSIFIICQIFYSHTSQQLKRLEAVSRSPAFSHFNETLAGISTIRAFNAQHRCMTEFENIVDKNQMACFPFICTSTWFGFILETFGNLVVFATALLALLSQANEGSIGMSVSYALLFTLNLSIFVKFTTLIQSSSVAIERIKMYTEVAQEAAWKMSGKKLPEDWPHHGMIVFKKFQIRYREGLELALKHINCAVYPREKMGIVGRTGAGKTSLTMGLFRIVEAAGGSIEIDGDDISQLGLHDIRSRLTIIPQDPVLFIGSIRTNIDPHGIYSDEILWEALEHAHLKAHVSSLPSGLESQVQEGGNNLSVGQRQLVCLARALLRKSSILILDEATAAVDLETDELIQKTIRSDFKDCTVVTIAHRLNTIMDYDRIMVLDNGVVVEMDNPKKLLQDTNSLFHIMSKEAKLI